MISTNIAEISSIVTSPLHERYGIAQFKLDRTCMQHGLDTTHFSFHMHASMRVHTRLMTSNLLYKALMYALDVCTTVYRCMRVYQKCTCQIWIIHINYKPKTAE